MDFWKRMNKEMKMLTVCGVGFFFVYLFLSLGLPTGTLLSKQEFVPFLILNQPDETINYTFIRTFALEGKTHIPESLSQVAQNQVHPRSTTVVQEAIVPIGFPGIVFLFGSFSWALVHVFGQGSFNAIAVSILPLIAAFVPIFFYTTLISLFPRRVAFLSALLLYILPPWWYYASRSFQHNTLFVSFLLLGGYFVKRFFFTKGKKKLIFSLLSGIFFALSIYIRPVEAVWVSALALFVLIGTKRRWKWEQLLPAAFGVVAVAGLFFFTQYLFYGHPLGTGYVRPTNEGISGTVLSSDAPVPLWQAVLAPFGFHSKDIIKNGYYYLVRLFPLFAVLTGMGVVRLVYRWYQKKNIWKRDPRFWYFTGYIGVSAYLLVFYGSWTFFDNLAGVTSIGSSHVRYFLPIYVGALPLISTGILTILKSRILAIRLMGGVLLFIIPVLSYKAVFPSFEGLHHIKRTVATYSERQKQIYQAVPEQGIIVTLYADKYIFPGRKVIPGFVDESRFIAVQNLIQEGYPVFWYDVTLPEEQYQELQTQLHQRGLTLEEPTRTWENLELRPIVQVAESS